MQTNADIQGLIKALEDADGDLRRPAAAALRALSAIEAIPALKRVLDQEHDPETRSSILAALAALELALRDTTNSDKPAPLTVPSAYQQAIEVLVTQMNGTDPKQVVTAALRLAKLRDMRCVEPLIVQFNNRSIPAKVRLMIAEALLDLESATGDVALLGALRNPKEAIRRSAATVLGQLRADWAVEPLAHALKDRNVIVRQAAQVALSAIDTPDARAALAAYSKVTKSYSAEAKSAAESAINAANPADPASTADPATTAPTVTGEHPIVRTDDDAPASSDPLSETPPDTPLAYAGPQDGLLRHIKGAPSGDTGQSTPDAEAESDAGTDASVDASVSADEQDTVQTSTQTTQAYTESRQKLSWPKRDTSQQESISTMVTRPLNPDRVKETRDDTSDRLDARTDDSG